MLRLWSRLRLKSKLKLKLWPKFWSQYSKGDTVHLKGTRNRKGIGTIVHSNGNYHVIRHSGTMTTTIHEIYMTLNTNTRLRHSYKVIASPALRTIRSKEGQNVSFLLIPKNGTSKLYTKKSRFSVSPSLLTETTDIINVVVHISTQLTEFLFYVLFYKWFWTNNSFH